MDFTKDTEAIQNYVKQVSQGQAPKADTEAPVDRKGLGQRIAIGILGGYNKQPSFTCDKINAEVRQDKEVDSMCKFVDLMGSAGAAVGLMLFLWVLCILCCCCCCGFIIYKLVRRNADEKEGGQYDRLL